MTTCASQPRERTPLLQSGGRVSRDPGRPRRDPNVTPTLPHYTIVLPKLSRYGRRGRE